MLVLDRLPRRRGAVLAADLSRVQPIIVVRLDWEAKLLRVAVHENNIDLHVRKPNQIKSSSFPIGLTSEGRSQKVQMAPGWERASLPFQKINKVVCTKKAVKTKMAACWSGPSQYQYHNSFLTVLYFPLRGYNPGLWKVLCLWEVLVWG